MSKAVTTGPDGRRIVYRTSEYAITVVTRRGAAWRKICTFGSYTRGEWFRVNARSARQGRQPERRTGTLKEPLSGPTVPLAGDFPVARDQLVIVLEALRSDERHRVDVDDIKVIVSQLGWPMSQLGTLPADQLRHAEAALYKEICRRCTSME